jgi:hypothetical protein
VRTVASCEPAFHWLARAKHMHVSMHVLEEHAPSRITNLRGRDGPAGHSRGTDAVPQGPQWCRSFNMREQPGWRLRSTPAFPSCCTGIFVLILLMQIYKCKSFQRKVYCQFFSTYIAFLYGKNSTQTGLTSLLII